MHYGYQQINIVKKIYRSTITKMVIFYEYNNNLILILTVSAFIAINSNMFIITTDTENPCPYDHFRSSPLILIIFKSKQDFYTLFIPFFSYFIFVKILFFSFVRNPFCSVNYFAIFVSCVFLIKYKCTCSIKNLGGNVTAMGV